jgi:sugar phosphate isomerase/epimerase
MRCSIAGYSFHGLVAQGAMNIFGYLESCRYRYHLDTADVWAGLMGKDPNVYLQPEFQAAVATALTERGLSLVNYHADGCHPWEGEAAKRDENLALAERHIAAAEKLGAKTIRIDPGERARYWSDEAFDYLVKTYKKWSKRASDNGYRIGPERHWGAGNHVDNLLKLAKAVDSPAFGILLHMGKDVDGSPEESDRQLAPYAMHTHLSAEVCYTRLESSLKTLIDAKYVGALGIEHHSAKNEYNEVAAQLGLVQRTYALLTAPPAAAPAK